jgi:hypothetical protein
MTLPITVTIGWYHLTESNWCPDQHLNNNIANDVNYRLALHIEGDISAMSSLSTKGTSAVFDWTAGLVTWPRIRHVDRLELTQTGIFLWIPTLVEPDDLLFLGILFNDQQEWPIKLLVPECPNALETHTTQCQISWCNGKPFLDIALRNNCTATWHYQLDGLWQSTDVLLSLIPDRSLTSLEIPYADTVLLEVKTTLDNLTYVHKWKVVGRPGVASGRYIWYRGCLYAPKITHALPWISVIVPVLHPDDIDRVPALARWHQIEWWVYPGEWTDAAISLLKDKFPDSAVVRLGILGDPRADVQILRPLEVQGALLNKHHRYAVQLFDDAGDIDSARRSGWLIERLMRNDMVSFRFIEHSWRQCIAQQNPTSNVNQYGLAFSFVRPSAEEYLWSTAQRDIEWRETRHNVPCRSCEHKTSCHQALAMPYASNVEHTLPWISLATGNCPLPAWFTPKKILLL